VNAEFTCAAGRGIWGFPKIVADIDVRVGRTASCRLAEDGAHILTLEVGRRPIPLPSRPATMSAYACADGTLLRTPFSSTASQVRGGPLGARLGLGERHPMALELRSLGLPKRALVSSVVGTMTARFDAPVSS
jgi:hypothetical protein